MKPSWRDLILGACSARADNLDPDAVMPIARNEIAITHNEVELDEFYDNTLAWLKANPKFPRFGAWNAWRAVSIANGIAPTF